MPVQHQSWRPRPKSSTTLSARRFRGCRCFEFPPQADAAGEGSKSTQILRSSPYLSQKEEGDLCNGLNNPSTKPVELIVYGFPVGLILFPAGRSGDGNRATPSWAP